MPAVLNLTMLDSLFISCCNYIIILTNFLERTYVQCANYVGYNLVYLHTYVLHANPDTILMFITGHAHEHCGACVEICKQCELWPVLTKKLMQASFINLLQAKVHLSRVGALPWYLAISLDTLYFIFYKSLSFSYNIIFRYFS